MLKLELLYLLLTVTVLIKIFNIRAVMFLLLVVTYAYIITINNSAGYFIFKQII